MEGVKLEAEKTPLDDDFIPINQVLIRIRDRAAKIAKIAQHKGNINTKNLHSDLLQIKESTSIAVLNVCSALKHNIDTANTYKETVQSHTVTL